MRVEYRKDSLKEATTKLPRLMERTGSLRSRSLPWFEDSRSTFHHHAEYLKRLSTMREDLITQEQTHLANALDRLRMRHQSRDNARHKLRQISTDSYPKRTLLTASEQFQRMRPRKTSPHIFPLEGKQLLDPQNLTSPSPQCSEKSVYTAQTNSTKYEDKLRTNLQRIIQPTSSIPNIGRKSTTQSKELILESYPIQQSRNMKKAKEERPPPAEVNPFKAVHKGNGGRLRSLTRPDSDELDLSPQTIQFENVNDRINFEKLKDYYCVYYLPNNSPVIPEDENEAWGDTVVNNSVLHAPKEDFSNEQKKKRIKPLEGKSIFPSRGVYYSMKKREKQQRNANSFELSSGISRSEEPSKRQIVVDMPSIVFNSAPQDKYSDAQVTSHPVALTKTVKQNELREKELRNLIEDVREINQRTEELTVQYN